MIEFLLLLTGAGFAYYLVLLLAAASSLSKRSARAAAAPDEGEYPFQPPISILKPVNGVDGNLYENLLSFVRQDYPEFEIVLGVQSADDPAIPLIEKLMDEFPDKNIKLVLSSSVLGHNPKINNLHGIFLQAHHDYMVISDSNVKVARDYLSDNVRFLADDRVGLVTNLIRGIGGNSPGARFENLHLNSFIIGNVSLLSLAGRSIVIGKSIFFRRSQFERLGGMSKLRNYLAEDYLMGRMYESNGLGVVVSPHVVSTTNNSWTMKKFLNRHSRWAQLRWNLNKASYAAELLLNFPLWAAVLVAATGFSTDGLLLASLVWGAKIAGDAFLNLILRSGLDVRDCIAAPFKDLVIGMIWPVPIVSSRTNWRGNSVMITRGTLLVPIRS